MALFEQKIANLILKVECHHTSQDINQNKSHLSYSVWLEGSYGYYNLYHTSRLIVYVDGQEIYSNIHDFDLRGRSTFMLKTGTHTVSHDGDGTKSTHIRVVFHTSTTMTMNFDVSGSLSLPQIPRAAQAIELKSATVNLHSAKTMRYRVQTSAFYNRLRISVPNVFAVKHIPIGQKSEGIYDVTTTLSETELASIYTRYTSEDRVQLGFAIESYSDSNYTHKIGESAELTGYYNFPANVKPSIDSLNIKELNTSVAEVLASNNYLNLLSNIRIQMVNARGVHGSTIRQSYVEIGNIRKDGTTVEMNGDMPVGSVTVKATVIDTRGRSATKSATITVLAYYRPKVTAFLPARTGDGTNKAVLANVIASVKPVYIGNTNKNPYTIIIERSERNNNTWQKMYEATGTVENITQTLSAGNDYALEKAYDIRLTVIDAFKQRQQAIATISTIKTVMTWGTNNVGVGKIPIDSRTLDVEGNVHVSGAYYVDTKPIQHHQLTEKNGRSIYRYGTDFNDDKTPGYYWHRPDDANRPFREYGWLEVHTSNTEVLQKFYAVNGRSFVRIFVASKWTQWYEISTQRKSQWTSTGVGGVFYKLDGNTMHVKGRITSKSNGNINLGSVPSEYVPQISMFTIPEWSIHGDRNVHLQVNDTGGMAILTANANMEYNFNISWGI